MSLISIASHSNCDGKCKYTDRGWVRLADSICPSNDYDPPLGETRLAMERSNPGQDSTSETANRTAQSDTPLTNGVNGTSLETSEGTNDRDTQSS